MGQAVLSQPILNASIDAQLAHLEELINTARAESAAGISKEHNERQAAIEAERRERQAADGEILAIIEHDALGSAALETIGALFIFVGLVLATFAPEFGR